MPFQAKNAFEKHVKAKALITFYFAKYRSKAKKIERIHFEKRMIIELQDLEF